MFSKRLERDIRTGPALPDGLGNGHSRTWMQNPADLMRSSREKGTEKAAGRARASPMLPCPSETILRSGRRFSQRRRPPRLGLPAPTDLLPAKVAEYAQAGRSGPRPQVRPRRPGHRDRRGRAQGALRSKLAESLPATRRGVRAARSSALGLIEEHAGPCRPARRLLRLPGHRVLRPRAAALLRGQGRGVDAGRRGAGGRRREADLLRTS